MVHQHRVRPVFTIVFVWVLLPASMLAQKAEHLAILDLEGRGISALEAASLTDRLRSELVRTGRITVVERGQMVQILAEQDLQLTGCTSDECAVQVGQLLGVTAMAAGSIGKVGATFSIDIRLIDVQTGKITHSLVRNYRGEIDGLLDEMTGIAGELVRSWTGQEPDPAYSSGPAAQPAKISNELLRGRYDAALTAFHLSQFSEAINGFEELLASGQVFDLADDSQYWLAECYFSRKAYDRAIMEFGKVFSYPETDKRDDARYKIGLCYWHLKEYDRARAEFQKLVLEYPDSEFVKQAKRYIRGR